MPSSDVVVDGDRLLMVAMELVMNLFALLYAFPHVPSRLLDSSAVTEAGTANAPSANNAWFSVASHSALKLSLLNIARTSPVFRSCMAELGYSPDTDLTVEALCQPGRLDELLGLNLYVDEVPISCQQMYHSICAAYKSLVFPTFDMEGVTITREWLARLFEDHGLTGAAAVGRKGMDRNGLLSFCSVRTVAWLQPYFASSPLFFHPRGLLTACA